MPTPTTTFRLSPEDRALIARLGQRYASPLGRPLPAVDVLRLALRRLDDSEPTAATEVAPREKKSRKS